MANDWSFRNILPNLQQAASNVGQAALNVPGNFVQKLQDAAQFGPQNLANAWQGARNVWSQPVGDVLSNAGTNALTGLGLALNAPKQAVYQQGNQFANAMGATGPDVKNFKDILVNRGMDPNALTTKGLGLAGDIATDPMTYALAGPTKQAMQSAGAGLRGMFGQGVKGLSTNPALREAAEDVAVFRDVYKPGLGEAMRPSVTHTSVQKPYQWAGRLARGGEDLREARRAALLSGNEHAIENYDVVSQAMQNRFGDLAHHLSFNPEAVGMFVPRANALGVRLMEPGAQAAKEAAVTLRHELTHAMINQAAETGRMEGLPLALRVPAMLQRSAMQANPTGGLEAAVRSARGSLAVVGHETAAHALESRGLLGQLGGAGRFLFNPQTNSIYQDIFSMHGIHPGVLRAYAALPGAAQATGQAAKVGAAAAGTGAAGAGTSALLDKLQGKKPTYSLYGLK